MIALVNGAEGGDNAVFLGADNLIRLSFLEDSGLPKAVTAPAVVIAELIEGSSRDVLPAKQFLVSPDGTLHAAGIGSFSIDSEEPDLARKQYYLWLRHDDGSGDSGKLDRIIVTSPGTVYKLAPTLSVVAAAGDAGTGATATCKINGSVTSVTVTTAGTGYVTGSPITFSDPDLPGGRRAVGTITASAGAITGVSISDQGIGYSAAPTATAPTGTGGVLTPVITGPLWPVVEVTAPGSGYKLTPLVYALGGNPTTAGAFRAEVHRGVAAICRTPSTITLK